MVEQNFTLQVYTPGSDIAVGFNPNQLIWGRTGNDTLLGLQPNSAAPGQEQIDLLIGNLAIDDPALREWDSTFILGDWNRPYYTNGDPNVVGLNDFALIADFNPTRDVIQLHGFAEGYQLLDIDIGSVLFWQQPTGLDAVGFLLGNTNLSLTDNYFDYQGITPPAGPQLPVQQLGSSGYELAIAVATDPDGNVYQAGDTTGNIGGSPANLHDALIAKYDNQGNLLWTKQFGSTHFDRIYDIETDNQGNLYVAGITEGNLAAEKQAEVSDAWVAKYDSDGNQLWIEQFGQNLIFQTFGIDVDAAGNVYLSGLDVVSSGDTALAVDDFWAAKFDTDGNRQWLTTVGAESFDESYDVTVSNDGSVYATGWTLSDLAGVNAGLYDAWITKFSNDGEVEWVRQFGTPDYEWSWGVDTDSTGNVYATGWTLGDLGGPSAGSFDAWLTKYDDQGNELWITQFGSEGDDQAFDIYIDPLDNIFLTGFTDGDLGGVNAGSFDIWVASFDTSGNQQWLQQFGTPQTDQAYAITGDGAGTLYVTGITQGSLGGANAGSFDAWLAKLDAATGSLLDFSSALMTDGAASSFSLLASTTSSPSSTNVATNSSASNTAPSNTALSDAQVEFIRQFFEDLLVSSGIGLDGSGLPGLLTNPYNGIPGPTPAPVPEPASGLVLLMLAIASGVGTVVKSRLHRMQ